MEYSRPSSGMSRRAKSATSAASTLGETSALRSRLVNLVLSDNPHLSKLENRFGLSRTVDMSGFSNSRETSQMDSTINLQDRRNRTVNMDRTLPAQRRTGSKADKFRLAQTMCMPPVEPKVSLPAPRTHVRRLDRPGRPVVVPIQSSDSDSPCRVRLRAEKPMRRAVGIRTKLNGLRSQSRNSPDIDMYPSLFVSRVENPRPISHLSRSLSSSPNTTLLEEEIDLFDRKRHEAHSEIVRNTKRDIRSDLLLESWMIPSSSISSLPSQRTMMDKFADRQAVILERVVVSRESSPRPGLLSERNYMHSFDSKSSPVRLPIPSIVERLVYSSPEPLCDKTIEQSSIRSEEDLCLLEPLAIPASTCRFAQFDEDICVIDEDVYNIVEADIGVSLGSISPITPRLIDQTHAKINAVPEYDLSVHVSDEVRPKLVASAPLEEVVLPALVHFLPREEENQIQQEIKEVPQEVHGNVIVKALPQKDVCEAVSQQVVLDVVDELSPENVCLDSVAVSNSDTEVLEVYTSPSPCGPETREIVTKSPEVEAMIIPSKEDVIDSVTDWLLDDLIASIVSDPRVSVVSTHVPSSPATIVHPATPRSDAFDPIRPALISVPVFSQVFPVIQSVLSPLCVSLDDELSDSQLSQIRQIAGTTLPNKLGLSLSMAVCVSDTLIELLDSLPPAQLADREWSAKFSAARNPLSSFLPRRHSLTSLFAQLKKILDCEKSIESICQDFVYTFKMDETLFQYGSDHHFADDGIIDELQDFIVDALVSSVANDFANDPVLVN